MYLWETANIMFLSFIRFELLSFEHGNPHITQNVKYNYLALLLGYNQVFFHPDVLIYFPFIFHTFCPYLESLTCFHGKYLIVQSLYVHLKHRKAGWKLAHVNVI